MQLEHSELEQAQVEEQMGRTLRGRWAVAARCHLGVPMVIENHPRLDDGSPFPTLYWLTCPILVKRVSHLEAAGWLKVTSDELGGDTALQTRLAGALNRFRVRRDSHEIIQDSGGPPGGGPDRVKCLHAHVAHQLAGGENPIGARGLAETGWPDCRLPCTELS